MKSRINPFLPRPILFTGACAVFAVSLLHVSSVQAEIRVWDGGAPSVGTNGTGVNMATANNWGTPGNPTANVLPQSGDTLEFSGYDSATTDLVMNGAFFPVPGTLAAVNVDQPNPLTFAGISGTSYLRMGPGGTFTVTNGAVTFNAGRIVFGVGTGTTESFTLTNNSSSPVTWGPGATAGFTAGTGPAAGGGRNITFAGSGDWLFNSSLTGTIAVLTKTGPGSLTLNSTNTLANAATTPLTISEGSIVIGGNGNVNAGNYASPIVNSAALVHESSANQILSGAISGTGSLSKNVSFSTLTLAGVNTYSGPTAINSGSLVFAGASTIGSVSLADQATLGAKVTNPSVSPLKPTSLALGATSNDYSVLTVDFGGLANPTVPVIDLGAKPLNMNGNVDVVLSGLTALTTSTNTIKLLNYGSITGGGVFTLATTSAGHSSFELNQTASGLYLNVTAAVNVWKGTTNGTWDGMTLNWSLPDGYVDGDTVIFNDTASVTSVNIASQVAPGSVTFSNSSAKTYTLSSDTESGIAGITPLILNGTNGTVVITNNNTYSGATTIGAGNTLRLGDGTIDGSINGSLSIVNNGTLVFNRVGVATYNGVISGTGSVVKEGSGSQRLMVANTYSGGTRINEGDLQIDSGSPFGTGLVTLAGGSITARIQSRTFSNPVAVTGDFTLNLATAGTNVLTLAGNVDLTGGIRTLSVFNGSGSAISGVISNGGLTKAGTTTLTLLGVNTYTGPTLISEGTLRIGNGTVDGSIDATSGIVNNAALLYQLGGTHTVSVPISGTGTVTNKLTLAAPNLADGAALVIGTGAVLHLGHSSTDVVASLTVAGNLLPDGVYTKDSAATQGFITGDGKIQIGAVAGGYSSWAAANAPGQTKDQDHDNDGADNGIEYFMGATGSSFTANPGLSGQTVTWTKGAGYTGSYGTDFVVQTSTDLLEWSPVPESGSGVVNSAGSVSYTPPAGQPKRFTRLVVNN
ncbi:MAG: hypothetical protein EOP88_04525 [Verrucomicrobiaceae bacterium]|nr:MAG: hypothetical protein EOP88_04525 [Verrucomicrobiaceae bacterium]